MSVPLSLRRDFDAPLQKSLAVAHRTGAIETKDLKWVIVDTTVRPTK
jgi:hypothetical protein